MDEYRNVLFSLGTLPLSQTLLIVSPGHLGMDAARNLSVVGYCRDYGRQRANVCFCGLVIFPCSSTGDHRPRRTERQDVPVYICFSVSIIVLYFT